MTQVFLTRDTWTQITDDTALGIVRIDNTGGASVRIAVSSTSPVSDTAGDELRGKEHRTFPGALATWGRPLNPGQDGLVDWSETGVEIPEENVEDKDPDEDSITNAMLAEMAQSRIKGRAAGAGTGNPADLTAAAVKAILGADKWFVGAQVFTTPGAATYTPSSGVTHAIVLLTGGGGGGGWGDADNASQAGAGSGGSAAATIAMLLIVSAIGTATLSIGDGGAGGTSGAGSNGGNTTWADGTTSATANAGVGGGSVNDQTGDNFGSQTVGGSAGTITAGANHLATLLNAAGGAAFAGFTLNLRGLGGNGGNSFWGGGARGGRGVAGAQDGADASPYGAGGGGGGAGGADADGDGGDGAGGAVIVLEFTTGA